MDFIALVTARSGSKSIIDKNLQKIEDRTLIEWSIKSCQKSKLIQDIYLSTDSENYAEIGIKSGIKVPYLRPRELAQDTTTDLEVFLDFTKFMVSNLFTPKFIVHIRPTSPTRNPIVLDAAIVEFLKIEKEITSLRSIQEMSESAYKCFELNSSNLLNPIGEKVDLNQTNAPRQSFPKTYTANGYVDIVKFDYFNTSKSLHGDKIHGFVTENIHEIDNPDDLEFVRWQVKNKPELYEVVFGENK